MNIIDLALVALGFVLGLYSSRLRDGLAYGIATARYPFYEPGEDITRDLEWTWTYHRVRGILGAS